MKTYIQLLYKSFYDTDFVKNYIKNGKGSGSSFLALWALIATLIFEITFLFIISPVFNTNEMNRIIDETFRAMPEVVVMDGELVWDEGVVQNFRFEGGVTVTVDTTGNAPTITDLQKSLIYVTRTDIHINNNGQIRSITLYQLQEMFGQNPLDLTSEQSKLTIISFVQFMAVFISIFMVFVVFFTFWLANIILASITRFISSKINNNIKNMEYMEFRRSAVISVIPSLIVMDLSMLFFNLPSVFVRWIVIIVIGIILMNKYTPASKDEKENNSETIENDDKSQKN